MPSLAREFILAMWLSIPFRRRLVVPKVKLSAKEVLKDIRSGMTDSSLMKKYGISPETLEKLFKKLLEKGLLQQSEIDSRVPSGELTGEPATRETRELRALPNEAAPRAESSDQKAGISQQESAPISQEAVDQETTPVKTPARTLRNAALVIFAAFMTGGLVATGTGAELTMLPVWIAAVVIVAAGVYAAVAAYAKSGPSLVAVAGIVLLVVNVALVIGKEEEPKTVPKKHIAKQDKAPAPPIGRIESRKNRSPVMKRIHKRSASLKTVKPQKLGKRGGHHSQDLVDASIQGNPKRVERLLKQGADVNSRDSSRQTGLLHAARQGRTEVVRILLIHGADINAKDRHGYTALMNACNSGRTEIVKLLLDRGADPNARDKAGRTALMAAAMQGRVEAVKMLLARGADLAAKDKFGMTAVSSASDPKVRDLLAQRSAEAAGDTIEQKNKALIRAAMKGQWELVKRLLEKGADINAKGKGGVTALMRACRSAPLHVVTLLLDRGTDPNAASATGWTPLMESLRWNQPLKMKLLLKHGADPKASRKDGLTVLMVASRWNGPSTVKLILDKGANINARTKQGWTALMFASAGGKLWNAKLLVARGADLNAVDKQGRTALSLAQSKHHTEVATLLKEFRAAVGKPYGRSASARKTRTGKLSKEARDRNRKFLEAADANRVKDVERLLNEGADINAQDPDFGMTALMRACWNGYREMVQLLLHRGADIGIRDKDGRTAMKFAEQSTDKEMVALLKAPRSLDRGAESSLGLKSAAPKTDPALEARRSRVLEEVERHLKQRSVVDGQDRYGNTALMRAAGRGRLEEVKLLIEEGADVNIKNTRGGTALLAAAGNGRTEVSRLLLAKGADVNAANNRGWTALIFAASNSQVGIVRLLLDKGADINAKDKQGQTALMRASANGHQEIVKLLLERQADPSIKDRNGRTAEQLATEKGQRQIAKILKRYAGGRTPHTTSPSNQ